MFWAADQVMGVGFTLYGRYGNTSCFNASKLSNYTSKYEVYTIAEFEKLFDEYYETVDPEKWQKRWMQRRPSWISCLDSGMMHARSMCMVKV